ncbi:hypothetical protein M3Y94_00967700 [Aphelenchoides besseyi]|nr:hypothetical protein M3Y94_00967700 [Aphelenchoides besseyi]
MNVRRLFVIGIAFVAMSMLGSVQAGLDLSGEKPVYTADGTSPGATLVLKGKEMKFTVEKAGTGKGDTSEMQMIVGGCTFKVAYTPDGDGSVSFGGNPALLKSPVGGSATETGITYGDSIPGTCSSGSTSFTADGDKFTLDVKFDYPEKDYPPLKFTFTNAKKYAPKKDEEAMGAETIAGLIVGAVVSFIVAVVAAVGFTWCCCWCEGCCFNDPKKCSKWNKKKQQRMKAEKGGENQEKEKSQRRRCERWQHSEARRWCTNH